MRVTRRSCKKPVILLIAVMALIKILSTSFSSTSLNGVKDLVLAYAKAQKLDKAFISRTRRIEMICKSQGHDPPTSVAESMYPANTIIDLKHDILYCPVEKVASTFLTNTLIVMNSRGKYKSPFQVRQTQKVKRVLKTFQEFQNFHSEDFRTLFMQKAMSLLVVRDPYTRLFSAYTDKLYHPNHYYWGTTGKTIEGMLNRSGIPGCGNTISFPDFVKYIIHEAKEVDSQLDPHFTRIYQHCDPCMSKYNYIVKFENLKEEFFHIMNMWNNKFNLNLTISVDDFERESAITIAEEHVALSLLTMKRYSSVCNISSYNFLLRTWRFLQITGIIPKYIDIPFLSNVNASLMTREIFLNTIKEVYSMNIDWVRLKAQRQEALVQAYQKVDDTDIEVLTDIMRKDCAYFGYDDRPGYLFNWPENTFDYFDALKN